MYQGSTSISGLIQYLGPEADTGPKLKGHSTESFADSQKPYTPKPVSGSGFSR